MEISDDDILRAAGLNMDWAELSRGVPGVPANGFRVEVKKFHEGWASMGVGTDGPGVGSSEIGFDVKSSHGKIGSGVLSIVKPDKLSEQLCPERHWTAPRLLLTHMLDCLSTR